MTVPYQPSPQVLDQLKEVNFVAVVGPTAVGKTTLIKAATTQEPHRLHMLVAGVSRVPRPGEQHGIDFHFGNKLDMTKRARRGEYVTVVTGATDDLYTTAPEDYQADKTVLMAVLAHAMPLFKALPFKSFRTIFIVPPDPRTWHARLGQHQFTAEQLEKRMAEAARSLAFAKQQPDISFIVNDNLNTATADFVHVALHGSPLPARLKNDQIKARRLVRELQDSLSTSAVA